MINFKSLFAFSLLHLLTGFTVMSQSVENSSDQEDWDIFADTWVGVDALGRQMPTSEDVGLLKKDKKRFAGIFYITWHIPKKLKGDGNYTADVTKVLSKYPEARLEASHIAWSGKNIDSSFHWAEPEIGYFSSLDEWVMRRDMSMLADAGIDVIIMDVTNAVMYWEEWDVLFNVMMKMKSEGNKVPKMCFWAYNGPVITVVQKLYERIYKENKFKDLWFYWDGKPLLLYNATIGKAAIFKQSPNLLYDKEALINPSHPHYGDPKYTSEFYTDYTEEVKEFFTLRNMWWGYYKWAGKRYVGTEDNWSFGYNLGDPEVANLSPEGLASKHNGKVEQFAVTAAQHPVAMGKQAPMGVGKSWSRQYGQPKLNKYDMPEEAYVPWLGKKVKHPEAYGIYFQERFDEMLSVDPDFLYLNDWNEWTAGKFNRAMNWLGRKSDFHFVDQYNAEYNRCIQPMKGGYTDNYYMQMAHNIRKYKGARSIPVNKGYGGITLDSDFKEWDNIKVEYRDTKGDIAHRDAIGYGGIRYTNFSGRNDIIRSKVSVDEDMIYFYVETQAKLTHFDDSNWMLLLLDADHDSSTGWFGYDFIINRSIENQNTTILQKYNKRQDEWQNVTSVSMKFHDNQLMIVVPKKNIGLDHTEHIVLDFKWADNISELKSPLSLCVNGDVAPNRRFNYRFIWNK